jgi:hypothetical protein
MVACYSEKYKAIFVKKLLHSAVERCAIAHEIVHYEYGDIGQDREQERRADRVAARRLVRPSRMYELAERTTDPEVLALEMNVTEHIVEVFLREHAQR